MKKALFLDFDGVLHAAIGPTSAMKRFVWAPLLDEILRPFHSVEVVVHASARDHTDIATITTQLGPLGCRVVDAVPRKVERYEAICAWLAGHSDVTDYRILDDEPREFPTNLPQLILCNPRTGISDMAIQRQLITWLSDTSASHADMGCSFERKGAK